MEISEHRKIERSVPLAATEATYIREHKYVKLVVPVCPHCGGRSVHGGGDDPDAVTKHSFGWRAAHCCGEQIELINAGMTFTPRKGRRYS